MKQRHSSTVAQAGTPTPPYPLHRHSPSTPHRKRRASSFALLPLSLDGDDIDMSPPTLEPAGLVARQASFGSPTILPKTPLMWMVGRPPGVTVGGSDAGDASEEDQQRLHDITLVSGSHHTLTTHPCFEIPCPTIDGDEGAAIKKALTSFNRQFLCSPLFRQLPC